MLLEITTTHHPATDLGYLLHKNPAAVARRPLSFGEGMVFYPEATAERCTAALLVEVDPVGLVRGRSPGAEGTMDQYVNDRPYVASSHLATAISEFYGTALNGRSKERQALAETPIPLEARLPVVPSPGGAELLIKLFEPLGYRVEAERLTLDPLFPEWGDSPYCRLAIAGTVRLTDLLRHLYVMLGALDARKHYWIGDAEVEKLMAKGDEWLPAHPMRDYIVHRYLSRRKSLARRALELLCEDEPAAEEAVASEPVEEPVVPLNVQRLEAVENAVREVKPDRVLDLGCGEGRLIARLMKSRGIREIHGADVSLESLEIAANRLHLAELPEAARKRIHLLQASALYVDDRFKDFDVIAIVEVIEHLDPERLGSFERVVFQRAHPGRVVLTTPNADYNVKWESLPAGTMRHRDHRFEWTREQFHGWATRVAAASGYAVTIVPIGPDDPEVGSPTQMAIFDRAEVEATP